MLLEKNIYFKVVTESYNKMTFNRVNLQTILETENSNNLNMKNMKRDTKITVRIRSNTQMLMTSK